MQPVIDWDLRGTKASASDLDAVERALRICFPSDYREVVLEYNGGTPAKRRFRVRAGGREFDSGVAAFLSVVKDDLGNIFEVCSWLDDRPKLLFPFGEDGGGDFICFDFATPNPHGDPTIWYWHRTGLPGTQFTQIAGGIADFMGSLS